MNLASDCFGLVATHLAIFLISGPYLPLTIMCLLRPWPGSLSFTALDLL